MGMAATHHIRLPRNWRDAFFFQPPETSPVSHDFSNMIGWLSNLVSQFLQDPGMHVMGPCKLVHIKVSGSSPEFAFVLQ